MDGLLPVVVVVVVGLVVVVVALLTLARSLRDVPSGSALVVRSLSGESKVRFERTLIIPLVQTAELLDITAKPVVIERAGSRGVRCVDGIRASLRAVFVVRVHPTEEDVSRVRRRVSAAGLASAEFVRELFAGTFTQALETVAANITFEELAREREAFKDHVLEFIGRDLDGFVLDDVSVTDIEMVPASEMDPEDLGDAPGIRKITEVTSRERLMVAEANKQLRTALAKLELDEGEILLALERRHEELSRELEARGAPIPDIDELRARLDERVRRLVDLVQARV